MKNLIFVTFLFPLVVWGQNIPANFASSGVYTQFASGRTPFKQKAVVLPASNFLLIYSSFQYIDESGAAQDPSDEINARIFVYDNIAKNINEKVTADLNNQLGADKNYDTGFCGGLGSLDLNTSFKVEANRVRLYQSYSQGTGMDYVCEKEIVFANQKIMVVKKGEKVTDNSTKATTTAAVVVPPAELEVAKQRNLRNNEALKLYQAGKFGEAIKIWEELYGYWKNGPYASAGAFDEVLNNLGFAYWKGKNYPKAEKTLLECKKYYPKRAVVYLNLGDLYRDMKVHDAAVDYYKQFLTFAITDKQKAYTNGELIKLK